MGAVLVLAAPRRRLQVGWTVRGLVLGAVAVLGTPVLAAVVLAAPRWSQRLPAAAVLLLLVAVGRTAWLLVRAAAAAPGTLELRDDALVVTSPAVLAAPLVLRRDE